MPWLTIDGDSYLNSLPIN